jgi:hypothetical protein
MCLKKTLISERSIIRLQAYSLIRGRKVHQQVWSHNCREIKEQKIMSKLPYIYLSAFANKSFSDKNSSSSVLVAKKINVTDQKLLTLQNLP